MGTYGLAASIVVVILLAFCALLVWRQQRQLDNLRRDIRRKIGRLEIAHEGLLVRLMNLPRSRNGSRAVKSITRCVRGKKYNGS